MKRKQLFALCGLVCLGWAMSLGCGGGSPCSVEVNQERLQTLTCNGVSYTIQRGKPGDKGDKGKQGSPGDKGVSGDKGTPSCRFAPSKGDPRTGILECDGKSLTLINGEVYNPADACSYTTFECGLVEVKCGNRPAFRVGDNNCNRFLVQELDAKGKVTKTLKSGDLHNPGDALDIHKPYKFTIEHKHIGTPLTSVDMKSFSNVRCSTDSQCQPEYCDKKLAAGDFDVVSQSTCNVDKDCAGQGGDICRSGVCYKKPASPTPCKNTQDCISALGEGGYCEMNQATCYRRHIDVKRYEDCKILRQQLEPECVYYPLETHPADEPPAFCVIFRFSGRFMANSDNTASEIRFSRSIPLGNACEWMKVTQGYIFGGKDNHRNALVWKGLHKNEKGDYELAGFVDFVDKSRQYFRYTLFKKDQIDKLLSKDCVCPSGYNPVSGQCCPQGQFYDADAKSCR